MMNQARLPNMGGPPMSQDTGIMPVGNPQTNNMPQSKAGMMMGQNIGPGPHTMVASSTGMTSMPSSTGKYILSAIH